MCPEAERALCSRMSACVSILGSPDHVGRRAFGGFAPVLRNLGAWCFAARVFVLHCICSSYSSVLLMIGHLLAAKCSASHVSPVGYVCVFGFVLFWCCLPEVSWLAAFVSGLLPFLWSSAPVEN